MFHSHLFLTARFICIQVQNVTAEYIMKCDDDTFVRLDIVLQQISTFNRSLPLYLGNLNLLHRPLRYGKWAVTFEVRSASYNVNSDMHLSIHSSQRRHLHAGMARTGVSPLRQRTRLRDFRQHCKGYRVPPREPVAKGKLYLYCDRTGSISRVHSLGPTISPSLSNGHDLAAAGSCSRWRT